MPGRYASCKMFSDKEYDIHLLTSSKTTKVLAGLVSQHILYKLYDQSSVSDFHFQPDEGAAVPPFGGWNENDPSSADMYTQAFNKVRQEKNPKSSIESNKSARQAYATGRKANNYNKKVPLHNMS